MNPIVSICFFSQLDLTDAQLESVLEKLNRRTNRFGLARPEDIPTIMASLNVEGQQEHVSIAL